MSGAAGGRLLGRLRTLVRRRSAEQSVRESIAELVQEAAEAPHEPGEPPELDRQERLLIANVLRLRGTTADDVMVPRADIVAMQADVTLEQALAQIRTEGHSRLPVYREQLDDIIGMVHIKDVFAYVGRPEAFRLETLLRHPLMVAPQIPVLDLLLQMRLARMHLALVVDEYGGIDGLLTIEDIVETIVGEIDDEHDDEAEPALIERADGSVDMDARLPVDAFETRFGPILTQEEREADIDTIGGLVFTLAGHVPTRGEVVSHPAGVEFRVLDADARRVRRLRARRSAPRGTAAEEAQARAGEPDAAPQPVPGARILAPDDGPWDDGLPDDMEPDDVAPDDAAPADAAPHATPHPGTQADEFDAAAPAAQGERNA